MDELLIPLLAGSALTIAIAAGRTVVEAIRRRRVSGDRKPSSVELSITDREGRNITIEVPADDEVALERAVLDAVARETRSANSSKSDPTA